MRSRMERVTDAQVGDAVADGWGLTVVAWRYVPEGGGAYHWAARADDGRRWFVTCDDLDTKPWLGAGRDTVFAGLLAAYGAAAALRAAGAAFVVAPAVSRSGAAALRIDDRHSVSVFEYVDGRPGVWGQPMARQARAEVVSMLAELHRTTTSGLTVARRGIEVAGRAGLERALDEVQRRWDGGPLSELARRELATHRELVVDWLADLDRAAVRMAAADAGEVVTHGEPHPGNLIRTEAGLGLVDWDTVAVARPERDLWMLVDPAGKGDATIAAYRERTGITLDREALRAYRLSWALADVAAFTAQLRGEHRRDADAELALTALSSIFSGREPAPFGAPVPAHAIPGVGDDGSPATGRSERWRRNSKGEI